jgi:surfeit locus 1 family protein
LVALFAGLGAWQINRGYDKHATQQLYRDESGYSHWQHGADTRAYQRLRIRGTFDADHQIVLENIITESRNGYYIVTPLVVDENAPLLLVNRGWLQKTDAALAASAFDLPSTQLTVRGRVGALPRAAFRMGDAVTPSAVWPKTAVYPTLADISAVLGRDVQPFVLLLDQDDAYGHYRRWQPAGFGPDKHFGYALQWFAMAMMLSGLLIWNYRKRRFS